MEKISTRAQKIANALTSILDSKTRDLLADELLRLQIKISGKDQRIRFLETELANQKAANKNLVDSLIDTQQGDKYNPIFR